MQNKIHTTPSPPKKVTAIFKNIQLHQGSHTHIIIASFTLEGTSRSHLVQPPAQSRATWIWALSGQVLCSLQEWRLHGLPGQPPPTLNCSHWENIFLHIKS